MRFVIVGAGAIGTAMGGYLAEAGFGVVLVSRPAHASVIRDQGLTMKTAKGILHPRLTALTSTGDVTWQSRRHHFSHLQVPTHSRAACRPQGCAATRTPIFCFQNGVRNEEWAAETFSNVYAGLVQISANFVEPGVVEHTRNDILAIGKYPAGLDGITTSVGETLGARRLPHDVLRRCDAPKVGEAACQSEQFPVCAYRYLAAARLHGRGDAHVPCSLR